MCSLYCLKYFQIIFFSRHFQIFLFKNVCWSSCLRRCRTISNTKVKVQKKSCIMISLWKQTADWWHAKLPNFIKLCGVLLHSTFKILTKVLKSNFSFVNKLMLSIFNVWYKHGWLNFKWLCDLIIVKPQKIRTNCLTLIKLK